MSVYDFFKKVALFADLPDDDLQEICENASFVILEAGEMLFAEGDRGDKAYIIEEGQLEIIKKAGGRQVLLAVRHSGDVIGELALIEEAPRTAGVRARERTKLIIIHKETLDASLASSPTAARAMLNTVISRWRSTNAQLRQSEQMAQLGTLTAGVAHELNNPAAAVKRGADQLRQALESYARTQVALILYDFSVDQQTTINQLALLAYPVTADEQPLSSLDRSNLEGEIEDWLDDAGVFDPWDLAPALVDLDFSAERLDELSQEFDIAELGDLLRWLVALYQTNTLLKEIGEGAGRISEIVKALKSYAYLDQAPVQSVNVHEGLNNTLVILRHKLKEGIEVRREYTPELPKIQAYGSELNQVWTNIIDNSADALEGVDGERVLTIRTREENKGIIVEIEDNGPGIPDDIQQRIFDAFFTTKPPGKGTGLGLNISYNIVVYKHHGDIQVNSHPGKTQFQIWLPLNFADVD